jgi:putative ABC transport system substrate-binding protein
MSYAPDLDDLTRRSAIYIDKLFRGANAADLPVEQASKYQFVISQDCQGAGNRCPGGVA